MIQTTIRAEVRRTYKLPARPGSPEQEAAITLQADVTVSLPPEEADRLQGMALETQRLRELLEGQADLHVRHVTEDTKGEIAAGAYRAAIQEQAARIVTLGAAGLNPVQLEQARADIEAAIVATRAAHDAIPAPRILPRV